MFKILFDSDQLVRFSKEEFSHYNSKPGFNWQAIIDSFYNQDLKNMAKKQLNVRQKENGKKKRR